MKMKKTHFTIITVLLAIILISSAIHVAAMSVSNTCTLYPGGPGCGGSGIQEYNNYPCTDAETVGDNCCKRLKSTSLCTNFCTTKEGTCGWDAPTTSKCTSKVDTECTMA